jgi:hypothetical protein
MDNNSLYIPIGITEKRELWTGFGKEEMTKSLITSIFLNGINFIIYMINKNISFSMIFFLTSVAGTIMFFQKDNSGLSVSSQLKNMIKYSKSQKFYKYKYIIEYEINE